jgi:large subunit ribosomal protein L26e
MSASLSKELRKKYGVRSAPVRKDDEVLVVRGRHKGQKGKVLQVYRKRWAIYIDKLTNTKADGKKKVTQALRTRSPSTPRTLRSQS